MNNIYLKIPALEDKEKFSIKDLFDRCQDFLNYVKKEYSGKSIIIVTHSAPYRALRHLILNHDIKGKLLDGKIDNCQVEEFEIKK